MFQSTDQSTPNYEKQKQYQRQQDKLRAMVANPQKPASISADLMIEDLLSNKDTFKKAAQQSQKLTTPVQNKDDFPHWLQPTSATLPTLYRSVWLLVKESSLAASDQELADTQKTSKLLLTSGLQVDVLGYIWNIANKTIPGTLTQFELNLVLALVGLAQSGCTFNNLSVLNLIPSAPIPVLNLNCLQPPVTVHPVLDEFQEFQSSNQHIDKISSEFSYLDLSTSSTPSSTVNDKSELPKPFINSEEMLIEEIHNLNKNNQKTTRQFPCIGSSPTSDILQNDFDDFTDFQSSTPAQNITTDNDGEDDFSEFQNAEFNLDPLETTVVSYKKQPTLPILTFPKLNLKPKTLNLPADSEKKLKNISQSKILSTLPESKISSDNSVSKMPNISVFPGSRGVGSRLAHHSLDLRLEKNKHCHRHHKTKVSPNTTPGTVSVESLLNTDLEEMFPKCKNGSFLLKETKIKSTSETITNHEEKTRQIEIPCMGTITETSLPSQVTQPKLELMSVSEDKYGALRNLVLEPETQGDNQVLDDFGDFLSANTTVNEGSDSKVDDDWTSWTKNDAGKSLIADNGNDLFGDILSDSLLGSLGKQRDINTSATVTSELDVLNLNNNVTPEVEVEGEFEAFQSAFDQSESVKCQTLPETDKDGKSVVVGKPVDWTNLELNDFMTTDVSTVELALSRHSSLPSLDLKISPGDDGLSRELIMKKTLDCCFTLLQDAVDLFESISCDSVLNEVFTTQQAADYIKNLTIVFYISERVGRNSKECSNVQVDIRRIWSHLTALRDKYHIKVEEDWDSVNSNTEDILCSICFDILHPDNTVQHSDHMYHTTCANLWVNYVETTLPCPT